MQWQTHAVVGANAVWIIPFFGSVNEWTPLYFILGALAALLPDIDAGSVAKNKGAKIHYIGYGLFGGLKGIARHRGFFHSFISVCLVFCACLPLGLKMDPFIPLIVALGYFSHLFIDQWNAGMQFFFPMKQFVSFVPQAFQFRVGSAGDQLFLFLGVMGVLFFILQYHGSFFSGMDISLLMQNPL